MVNFPSPEYIEKKRVPCDKIEKEAVFPRPISPKPAVNDRRSP
jgi:hypothetical protein